ncbi:site-2 protease family protein, partial [Mycobacterium tuberculosis]|nr:site-2 protease family protein [Mycobacterium tuberculosis]
LKVMPQAKKDTMGNRFGQIGAAAAASKITPPPEYIKTIQYTPIQAVEKSVHQTVNLSAMTLKSMGKMLMGTIGVENLSGPIT